MTGTQPCTALPWPGCTRIRRRGPIRLAAAPRAASPRESPGASNCKACQWPIWDRPAHQVRRGLGTGPRVGPVVVVGSFRVGCGRFLEGSHPDVARGPGGSPATHITLRGTTRPVRENANGIGGRTPRLVGKEVITYRYGLFADRSDRYSRQCGRDYPCAALVVGMEYDDGVS